MQLTGSIASYGGVVANKFTDLNANKLSKDIQLGASANLNNIRTTGIYAQPLNADAATGANYPLAAAGTLMVFNAGGAITTQQYCVYDTGNLYVRSRYMENWSPWKLVIREGDIAIAATNVNNTFTKSQRGAVHTINCTPDGNAETVVIDLSIANNFHIVNSSPNKITLGIVTSNRVAGQSGVISITSVPPTSVSFGDEWVWAAGAKGSISGNGKLDYITYYAQSTTHVFGSMIKDIR